MMLTSILYKSANLYIEPSERAVAETIEMIESGRKHFQKINIRVCFGVFISAVCVIALMFSPVIKNFIVPVQNIPPVVITPDNDQNNAQYNDLDSIYINIFEKYNEHSINALGPYFNHYESWIIEKYIKYLGIDPRPSFIPAGLSYVEKTSMSMAYRDDNLVNTYNTWIFEYIEDPNSEKARQISVYTNTFIPYFEAPTPYVLLPEHPSFEDFIPHGTVSVINGTNVEIWYNESGTGREGWYDRYPYVFDHFYCAYFMYKNVGFTVTAENGVTQQEYINVLRSIIK